MLKVTVFSAALLAGTCVFAQQDTTVRPGSGVVNKDDQRTPADMNGATTRPSDQGMDRFANLTDDQFVKEAASGGMSEVKLGQIAQENSSNADVKMFGQHMVTDHSKANDELKATAGKANITVPADIDSKDQRHIDRLQALKGDDFDRAYSRLMVRDHRQDIKLFEAEASRGQNADLRTFASNTLPTLRNHLKMAEDNAQKLGVNISGNLNDESAQPAGAKIQGNQGDQPAQPAPGQGVVQPEGQPGK